MLKNASKIVQLGAGPLWLSITNGGGIRASIQAPGGVYPYNITQNDVLTVLPVRLLSSCRTWHFTAGSLTVFMPPAAASQRVAGIFTSAACSLQLEHSQRVATSHAPAWFRRAC